MFIKKFVVENYRSLKNIEIDNLSKINIFYGENNTGKSNILSILDFFFNMPEELNWGGGHNLTKNDFYNCDTKENILLTLHLTLSPEEVIELEDLMTSLFPQKTDDFPIIEQFYSLIQIKCRFNFPQNTYSILVIKVGSKIIFSFDGQNRMFYSCEKDQSDTNDRGDFLNNFFRFISRKFKNLSAETRFLTTERDSQISEYSLNGNELGRHLFHLKNGTSPQQKIFNKIVKTFEKPPFNFGTLIVSREGNDPLNQTDLNIFLEKNGLSLPISHYGSSVQKLLILLKNIFVYHSDVIAIEEPEMNLSPHNQEEFFQKLIDYTKNESSPITQLFITSHSPIFGNEQDEDISSFVVKREGNETKIITKEFTSNNVEEDNDKDNNTEHESIFDKEKGEIFKAIEKSLAKAITEPTPEMLMDKGIKE